MKAVAQQGNGSYEYSDFAIGATEAAIKYLLMSGLASSLLLFGTSMRYGETGTTNLALGLELQNTGTPWLASSLGILIVTAGLIKIAASALGLSFGAHRFCRSLPVRLEHSIKIIWLDG